VSPTWEGTPPPPQARIGPVGWLRVGVKGPALALLFFGGLGILLLIRFVERPVHGIQRPWTPWISQVVCRSAFVILGMRHVARGERMASPGAVVANHSSWLDILALNARKRVYFVSKAEVARWPAIGWLAKATGTVFISRVAREAKAQKALFEARLGAGHKLLFFPEGTSSDGLRVLPFKSTLFAAFLTPELRDFVRIQPVTVVYEAPPGEDPQFYGWWGDMDFGTHLLKILAAPRQGTVTVTYHQPVAASDFADRKALARHCEATVRAAFPDRSGYSAEPGA
jgi:1-acyl-sn-glycerol-3-phosphate acyltransferase